MSNTNPTSTPPPLGTAAATTNKTTAYTVVQQPVLYNGKWHLKGQTIQVADGDVERLGKFIALPKADEPEAKPTAPAPAPVTPAVPSNVIKIDQPIKS